eukprot:146106-Pleurochrysis_carterae.AAC.1
MALQVACEAASARTGGWHCGGNMAAAHSGWALDSPAQQVPGCCFYCILPKQKWFDRAACEAAPRRNIFNETCAAHLNPYLLYSSESSGLPFAAGTPSCPHCKEKLTAKFIAHETNIMEAMSISQLNEHLLRHRQTHAGKEKHAEIEILMDHLERAPSLLHHRINSCATSIAVTLSNKAPPAVKKKMNAVLESHGEHWAFATSKSQRDTRPSGNESRNLLTKPGLLNSLLQARYSDSGDAQDALCALNAAQAAAPHVLPTANSAAAAAAAAKRKRKRRREVTDHGDGGA